MIDHAGIAALIPHTGTMCLLAEIVEWTEQTITCRADSHRDPTNPLRDGGMLPSLAAIEYAAQAMAAHGALIGNGGRSRGGYLASLRDVVCTVERMDTVPGALTVKAEQLMGSGAQMIYQFAVEADGVTLVSGRAAVVLEAV